MSVLARPSAAASASDPSLASMLAEIAAFVPDLKCRAAQTEQDRRVSPEVMARLKETGFFRVLQPRRFGGLEWGFDAVVRLNIALGRGCGSTAWCSTIATIHNWVVGLFPLEAQEDVWSDPDALVAGAYAPNGTCEAVADGYVITGAWAWASNCDNSEWAVICTALPRDEPGPPNLAWCLIPRSDFEIEDTWFSAGMAGTGSKTVRVDQPTFVPTHRVLTVESINSGEAPGSRINDNPLYRLTFTGTAPFTLSSVPLGIASGALDDFVELASSKMAAQPGSPPRPMHELAQVQLAIADASASIDGARLMLLRDVDLLSERLAAGELPSMDDRLTFRRDHSYAAVQAAHATTVLFEAMGASGGDLQSPVQRAWRDTNVIARHISLSWANTGAMYGRHRLGQPPRGTF